MFGCECLCWSSEVSDLYESEPEPFYLPSPIPQWPEGQGFATGKLCLGEIEVSKITKFERIWKLNTVQGKSKGISFYKPVGIPDGFFTLGHYCQSNDQPFRGYVLVARDINPNIGKKQDRGVDLPALKKPLDYTLVWSTGSNQDEFGYIWLPNPPKGYKAMGFVVTEEEDEPEVDEVRCVRSDLTKTCETYDTIFGMGSSFSNYTFRIWNTRPCNRGMFSEGVSIGTFFCSTDLISDDELNIACLRNLDSIIDSMPNLNQIHSLVNHYGPTIFFHPDEVYLPSSVAWFFKHGALLCCGDKQVSEPIDCNGTNLPKGGENDGEFWIDLPNDDDKRNNIKCGNLESAKLYIHVKPALGGTFTDIVMWIFCPFNGPSTIKVGVMSIAMTKIGEHIGDWEHFTLRVSNFTGELWGVYFSQHSGGKWTYASDLEYMKGNKPIIYSSKNGHACFPFPGTYLQGSSKLGIGLKNETARSKYVVDSSTRYQIVAAEYLGNEVIEEPCWLQYMREWGPTITYDGRSELEKIIHLLPIFVRFSVENIFDLFPTELYGEEGPTGPKEKDNWFGDERC